MKNAPNEIFLNLGDDKDVLDSDFLELPSSEIGWMGQGFCSQEHYQQARAKMLEKKGT